MFDSVRRWLVAPASLFRSSKALHQRSWPKARSLRSHVRSWLRLHLIASSSLLHVLLRRFGHRPWFRRRIIRVAYQSGFSLFLPLTDAQSLPWMVELMSEHYLSQFEQCFDQTLSFEAGDVILDIGANVGRFAVPLFLAQPEVKVFAYEPNPEAFACLSRAVTANRLDQARFHLDPRAVYGRAGRLTFSPGCRSTIGSVTDVGFALAQMGPPRIEIEATSLEDIFEQNAIERCRLMKIDSEGSEYSIFETAPPKVLARIDALIMEIHPVPGRHPEELREHLRAHGFDIRALERPDGSCEVYGLRS